MVKDCKSYSCDSGLWCAFWEESRRGFLTVEGKSFPLVLPAMWFDTHVQAVTGARHCAGTGNIKMERHSSALEGLLSRDQGLCDSFWGAELWTRVHFSREMVHKYERPGSVSRSLCLLDPWRPPSGPGFPFGFRVSLCSPGWRAVDRS